MQSKLHLNSRALREEIVLTGEVRTRIRSLIRAFLLQYSHNSTQVGQLLRAVILTCNSTAQQQQIRAIASSLTW